MVRKQWLIIFIGALVLAFWGSGEIAAAQDKVLHVYGPGGPLGPMEECAQLFSKAKGVEVKVTAGPEAQWLDQARKDADLIFGGAEYMLTDFILRHPEMVDPKTRTSLYVRPVGILVRKGNPKRIRSLNDLTRDDIRILDVNGAAQVGLWEDLAGPYGIIPAIQKNIALSVTSSAEAIEKWQTMPELDAWITFESWHYRLKDDTELVEMPRARKIYRGTPIAVTTITKQRDLAQQFIAFLRTDPAHNVFKKWGWK